MKYLYEELINFDVEVKNAEEAILYNSNLLYEKGFVDEGYAQKVIDREKEFPTGLISTGRGIAIPHTNTVLVKKPALCILIPNNLLKFKMMGTTDEWIEVSIVIQILIKDSKEQMSMLKKLMTLMKKPELLDQIYYCKDKSSIAEMLRFVEEE